MKLVERWLLTPAPPERLAMLRMLIMGYATAYLIVRAPSFWTAAGRPSWQWQPVGLLWFVERAPAAALVRGAFLAAVLVGAASTAGWRHRLTGPLFAALFLLVTTHRLSWGSVLHTEHLVVLHVIIVGLTPAAAAWSWDARRLGAPPPPGPRFGWPIRAMALATIVGYVVAGVAKLRYGGDDWLAGDVLRNQVAFDNLRKELLGDRYSPLGAWAVQYGFLFPPIAWATVFLEVAAPMALLGGRLRSVWVSAAWGFHVGTVALMAIVFPYPLLGVAYAPLFAVERLARRPRVTRRRRPTLLDDPRGSPRAAFVGPHSHPPAHGHRRWRVWAGGTRSRRPQQH